MNRLELKPATQLTIAFEGKDYAVSKPPLGVIEDFEANLEAAKDNGSRGTARHMKEFLMHAGLPEDVIKKLDGDQVVAVAEFLSASKKN